MKTHTTFIVAIYTHYLANSLSPELPAVFICNNIQNIVYEHFCYSYSEARSRSRRGASASAT